jgi:hypothetical protein
VKVEFSDPEPNGLAAMIGALIEANLARHPQRVALLKPAVIDLTAPDAGVSVSIEITPGLVSIGNGGSNGARHVHVRADSHALLQLSSVPLRLGLPDPLTSDGRRVLGKVLRLEIRIDGLLRHPGKLTRLSRLLSVA